MKEHNMPLKPLIKGVGKFFWKSATESTVYNNFNSKSFYSFCDKGAESNKSFNQKQISSPAKK